MRGLRLKIDDDAIVFWKDALRKSVEIGRTEEL